MSTRFHLTIHALLIAFGIFAMLMVVQYRHLVDSNLETIAFLESVVTGTDGGSSFTCLPNQDV